MAAALKFFYPAPEAMDRLGLLLSPRWQLAAVEAEALLGLWLLTGALPRLFWIASLLGFTLLGAVSLVLGIEGRLSCGCFGAKVAVNPWYVFGLDLAAVLALVWWRPGREHQRDAKISAMLRAGLAVAAGCAVILGFAFGTLSWTYGSLDEGLIHLRGEWITVEPVVSDVGAGAAGDKRTFAIKVTNHSGRPVHVLGGTASCNCVATEDLPVTISASGSRWVQVQMTFQGRSGPLGHTFVLYTDDKTQASVRARFVGRVMDPYSVPK